MSVFMPIQYIDSWVNILGFLFSYSLFYTHLFPSYILNCTVDPMPVFAVLWVL